MEDSVFYELVKNSTCAKMLKTDAQSHLFCSKDTTSLLFLAKAFIEKENNKTNSADIVYLPVGERVAVSDIEQITSSAHLTPLELKYKYFIIKSGETMNDFAANKLLKILEEPPAKVKIIILSTDEYSVLPTIRSRCIVTNFPPFSFRDISLIADKLYIDSPNLKVAKALSLGSISRLKKAILGEYQPIEDLVFDTLLNMKKSNMVSKYSFLLQQQKEAINDIIDMFELVFTDVLKISEGGNILLSHRIDELNSIARFYDVHTIIRLKSVIDKARERLINYGHIVSIIDEFLFSLLEVRQRCQL